MSSKPAAASVPAWAGAVQAVSRAFGVFSALLIVVAIGVICQMVFVRAVLGQSAIWQTEFSIFATVAATFLGAPYILLTRGHVAVDVLPLMVGHETRRWLFVIGYAAALVFCALFLWAAIPWWYETWASNQTTSSIWRARLWIPYLAVPVGLALLCLQLAVELVLVLERQANPFNLRPDEGL
ncbi:MAG TPA: TRAP transporter small permease [Ottowia sp.]|uniref:TRAP transporter small permease subunit n=1 Tax=Ottowia sp. TaxID=1898956 RepID=UPI002BC37690|nr:TRAP transporter small permease [Ottowia sp.]HMN20422.1 TRAP transporter small permease [Ottowia sp.]